VPPNRLAQVVQLVRHGVVDRLPRRLHVFAKRIRDLVDGNSVDQLLAPLRRPLRAPAASASRRRARQCTRLACERARRALATASQEKGDPRARDEAENGRRQQVVLIIPRPLGAAV